jgi:LuxR family maltose regulon positive regulatory protein
LSFNTIKTHTRNIYRKLGVAARADAISRARELSLI